MTADPLVSVIIPTRFRQALAVRAVRSALGQTYRRLEVWVVDDGNEPPLSLPEDLRADPRLHTLRNETSRGGGVARNRAIEAARGELVAFLDDDDLWHPEKTARQVAVLEEASTFVAGVESGWEMVRDGHTLFRYLPDARRDLATEILAQPVMAPSSTMFRRETLEEAGGFSPHRQHHDWELFARIAERYRMVPIPEIHARRLTHPPISPERRIADRRYMLERLAARIALLPEPDRRRVLAFHDRMLGAYHAELGQRRDARRLLWRSWRGSPDWRPLAGILRTVIGERTWGAITGLARGARRGLLGPPTYRW